MSSSNDEGVFSSVHAAVAAVAESTTDESDNAGGFKGPVVPGLKGNDDVAVSKVVEKKNSGVDDSSGSDPAGEVVLGGGEVAGQEKIGVDDNVGASGAVASTTVDDAHFGGLGDEHHPSGGGGVLVGAETEGKDGLSVEQEADSIAIDVMLNKTRRSLMKRIYERRWNQPHRSGDSSSVNTDILSDVSDNVEVGSVDQDETESDDVRVDEDTNEDQAKPDEDSRAEVEVGEDKTINKKQQQHHDKWVNNYNNMVTFYNSNGHCIAKRNVDTAEGKKLGNWVHDQRKKFKAGTLADDRISLLSELEFDFSMQTNVVEKKLTVPIAISRIFKYKREHGNVAVPNEEPHKQLRRWIVHAKATSKKIIAQGSGNPKFTLPNLKLLHELGIIQLPPNFKLVEKTTTTSATKKEKKTPTAPPKAEANVLIKQKISKKTTTTSATMKEKKVMNAPPTGKSTPPPKAKAKALIQKKVLEKTTMTSATKKEQKKTTARPKATADVTIEQKISKKKQQCQRKRRRRR
jgi:hypothetical protein